MLKQLNSLVNKLHNRLLLYAHRPKPVTEVFAEIYHNKVWTGESYSGPGSDLEQTRLVRKALEKLIVDYNIKTLLDVPCGDWFWMKVMDLSKVTYVGGDIVDEIIRGNQQYDGGNISFQFINLLESEIAAYDLVLCRDCLVHFSYRDVRKALHNLINSGSHYLLTTTFPGRRNYNIITGDWRPIDLQTKPFNLPNPLMVINEGCTEMNGNYADKSLALWDLRELKHSWGV